MRSRLPVILLLLAAPLFPLEAQEAELSYKSTELAPGLYALEGVGGFVGGNMTLSIGEDGTVLIDDGIFPLGAKLMAAIAELSDAPIDFLVNTHVHGDHVGANQLLGEAGATIVAHENLRRRLIDEGMTTSEGDVPAPKEALPVLTFADSVTIHLNGRDAFVFHVANAHTDGDAIIHFRDDNVIHAGDVFFSGLFPYVDLDSGGSVDGCIAALERVIALADDSTKIVPGHGELADRKGAQASLDLLKQTQAIIRELVEAGRTEEQILAANPLAEYDEAWSWRFITTERMTRMLVRSLTED